MWCSVQRGSVPLSRRWVAVSHHRRQISPWFAWFTTQRWEIAAVDEEEEVPSLCSMFGNYCTFHSGFSTKKMFHGGSAQIQRIQVGCFICNQLHHKRANLIWWSSLSNGEQVRRSHKQIFRTQASLRHGGNQVDEVKYLYGNVYPSASLSITSSFIQFPVNRKESLYNCIQAFCQVWVV